LFGIANQLLATTALALVTTVLVKSRRPQFAIATLLPLLWLLAVTMTAGWQKILDADPRIGFWTQAEQLSAKLASGAVAADQLTRTQALIFNNRLDAALTAAFMLLVAIVVLDAARAWWRALSAPRLPEPNREVLA